MLLQLFGRRLGASEGNRVLAIEVVEEITDAATDQLQASRRQYPGFDDAPNHELRQVSRTRCRLHDGGNARCKRRRQLFEHAPYREVESVDVHCGAELRGIDVLPHEGAVARELLGRPVEVDVVVRHFAPGLAGEHEQRGNAPVDVDPAVRARRTGLRRQCVEILFLLHQVLRERLQHVATLVEGHLPELAATDLARVLQHAAKVQPVARDARDRFARYRAAQGLAVAVTFDPAVLCEITEFHHCDSWAATRAGAVRYRTRKELNYSVSDCTVGRTESKRTAR